MNEYDHQEADNEPSMTSQRKSEKFA